MWRISSRAQSWRISIGKCPRFGFQGYQNRTDEFEETERGRASAAQSLLLCRAPGTVTIENLSAHLRRRSVQFPVSIFESQACSVTRAAFDRLIAFSCVDLVLLFLTFDRRS